MEMSLWYSDIIKRQTNITMGVLHHGWGRTRDGFLKAWNALANQLLNRILSSATRVFDQVNLSLFIWSYIDT